MTRAEPTTWRSRSSYEGSAGGWPAAAGLTTRTFQPAAGAADSAASGSATGSVRLACWPARPIRNQTALASAP